MARISGIRILSLTIVLSNAKVTEAIWVERKTAEIIASFQRAEHVVVVVHGGGSCERRVNAAESFTRAHDARSIAIENPELRGRHKA